MTVEELIQELNKFPGDMKVLIDGGDSGWYDLVSENIRQQRVYTIWHSDWNNNGRPYTSYDSEPSDGVYVRKRVGWESAPDYVYRTISSEQSLVIG